MKKIFAVVLVLFVVLGGLFAARTDISASVGYGLENYWQYGEYCGTQSLSLGLTAYRGARWGFVFDANYEFPQIWNIDGTIYHKEDYKDIIKNSYIFAFTLGPAYTLLTGRFSSYVGFGPTYKESISLGFSEDDFEYDIDLGLGAVLMLKYYITDTVFANFSLGPKVLFYSFIKYNQPEFVVDEGVLAIYTTARLGVGVSF